MKSKPQDKSVASHVTSSQASASAAAPQASGTSSASGANYVSKTSSYARPEDPCVICSERHRLLHCEAFRRLSPRERLDLANRNKLCHNCLKASHNADTCRKQSTCSVKGCGEKHTMYLHIDAKAKVSTCNSFTTSKAAYMPIIQVIINGSDMVYALLDSGSSNSFCSQRLVKRLGIQGQPLNLTVNTLCDTTHKETESINLSVSSLDGQNLELSGVYVIGDIPVQSASIDVSVYDHLKDLEFPYFSEISCVDLLLGQDCSEALIPIEIRKGNKGEPFAMSGFFGWCLNGRASSHTVCHTVISNFITTASLTDQTTDSDVERLWYMENEGIEGVTLSQADKSVIDLWDRTCRKTEGHYELPIPWKNPDEELPNNVEVAKSRLNSLVKKLSRENLFDRYDAEIDKLLSKGYAERVPDDEIFSKLGKTWYLPHHGAISDKKPDKLRVVYDCASKYGGKSLNERCLQGPDLVNKLLCVLLRLRRHSIAIQADVEAMYNQIRIPSYDRDALRFLWYSGGQIVHYRMTSHLFGGIWCASSSTYALRKTIEDSTDVNPLVKDTIEKSFYVDDCLRSVLTKLEAKVVIDGTTEVLDEAGLPLKKFIVNDPDLLSSISEELRAKEVRDITPESCGKVLGIKWNISADTFSFDVSMTPANEIT